MNFTLPPALEAQPDPRLWLSFDTPGHVAVRTGKVELGQGILTALSQLAADGLGADAQQVNLLAASTAHGPNEGGTIGSLSIQQSGPVMSTLGAIIRWRLLQAAAADLKTDPETLEIRRGEVWHHGQASGWSYWRPGLDLLRQPLGPGDRVPPTAGLISAGTSIPRTDLRAKIMGGAFIHDMKLPGMLHGAALRQPVRGARIKNFDTNKFGMRGLQAQVVRQGDFMACVATSERQAREALSQLQECVEWDAPTADTIGEDVAGWLARQPAVDSVMLSPAPQLATASPDRKVQATWTRPFIAHASIGLSCALAWVDGEVLRVWTHSQTIFGLRDMLALVLGRSPQSIQVQHVAGAGCYGHNGADDVALDAALIACALPGQPVRVQWSRAEELREAPLGAPMAVSIEAALDDHGLIAGWNTHIRSTSHQMRPGVGGTPNLLAAPAVQAAWQRTHDLDVPEERGGGATRSAKPIYRVGTRGLTLSLVSSHVRTSALRALGTFANAFAIEGMMDMLAERAGCDPAEFRRRHLEDPRALAVLEKALNMAKWRGPGQPGEGRARGLGLSRYKDNGAWCAIVVDVELDTHVRVRRLWCAVDGGFIVNPDGALNQIEGGILQTISWTLLESVRFDGSRPSDQGWETYPILRFTQVPLMETAFVGATENPSLGLGEVAQGATVAAIANAVSFACEKRVTDLPISRERLLVLLTQ